MNLRATPDQAAVEAFDDERIRATLAADIDALMAIYSEDLVYVHASGLQDTRASLLASLREAPTRIRELRRDAGFVRVYGDTAVLNGAFSATVMLDGARRTVQATFTSVWVRSGARWMMVASQSTAATPA